jgi:tetratricopeptide (TPR) repeat protein
MITELKLKTPITIIDPALKAHRLYSSGSYNKAGVLYEKLFRTSHYEFHLKRAIDCFEKAGNVDKVMRLAQNGVKNYPENLTYPLIIAECLYNKGQINGAIALLHSIELRARGSVYFTDLLEKTRSKLGLDGK